MPEKQLNLSNLQPAQPREDRKRVGRGLGSGKGRYSGRGIKGQKSRSGSHKMRAGFEGGQTPLYMRLGKLRGATSKDAMPIGPFRTYTQPVNIRDLDRFDAGDEVTPETLVEKRLIKNTQIDVKLLGVGEITKKLTVRVHAISASRAREDRGRRRHRRAPARAEGEEGAAPQGEARGGRGARRQTSRPRRLPTRQPADAAEAAEETED